MKKIYVIFFIFLILGIIGIFTNPVESKTKKNVKKEISKTNILKEEFRYSTKDHDNINNLVKETIVEEVKVNYVCEKEDKLIDTFMYDKYYDLNGEEAPGFKIENNNIYYYENNEIVKGVKKVNNIRYYFDFDTGKLIKKNIKSVIDISTWQDEIDFDTLYNSGLVDGIIVRVGFGSLIGEDCTMDNRFERNISEIKRLGIPYGIYFYGYAQNEETSKLEASFVSNIIKEYDLDLSFPIFYDAELTSFHDFKYTKSVYKKVINTFIEEMNNNGYNDVGIYGNVKMFNSTLSFLDKKIPKWVADYSNRCSYNGDYIAWQYKSSEKIPGINGNVDINIFY